MEEQWFTLMSFCVGFPSEPHIAILREVTECLIHLNSILVLKQGTYFSAKEVMQWARAAGFE